MKPGNVSYSIVLDTFKHEAYLSVKDEVEPKVSNIDDRDDDHKIIH